MDRAELLALLTPEGLGLLENENGYRGADQALAAVSRLRKEGHDPLLVSAVLTQARLRSRARVKFGEFADRMLFTEQGLEQATRLGVAARHAARFRAIAAPRVLDLGCGIGGDSLALSALGLPVLAVEHDEATATLASFNLAPFPEAEVRHADAREIRPRRDDAIWLDPTRRSERGRISDPDNYEPSLTWALERARSHDTGIKLSPAMDRELIPDDLEAQWVSADGSTVELVLWSGALAREGVRRSAVVIDGDSTAELTAAADSEDAPVVGLSTYLYEPEGSVIRARLIGELARSLGLGMLSEEIAYLSGDRRVDSPFLSAFRVIETMPLKVSTIRTSLAYNGVGVLEIKKRGVDIDPAAFRRTLAPRGENAATLFLTRLEERRVAILAERLSPPSPR